MVRLNRKLIIGTVAVVIVAVGTVALVVLNYDQPYDRAFDRRVADPAYRANGPIVLYDEGHLNTHSTAGGYKPLADLLHSDGYTLRVSQHSLTASALEIVTVLVLVLARGSNDVNNAAAYSEAEAAVIEEWVRAGGSLLLISDHWPYGSAVSSLARRFDIAMGAGLVQDATHSDPERGDSHLVFSAENGLLRDHPIVRGRSPAERVRRVLTFTGQSLKGPATAVPFYFLSAGVGLLLGVRLSLKLCGDSVEQSN